MGLLTLSKLTVSLSTVGGALLGSYFAVPSLLAGESGTANPTVPELSEVNQSAGNADSSPSNQQPPETVPEQSFKDVQGTQETENREELDGVEVHKETSPTPEKEDEGQITNSSLTRSDKEEKDHQEDSWRNIEFSDVTLKNEDTTIKEIDGLGGNELNYGDYLSDSEESEEDKEEELQPFEYYEDDYSEEEDEEGTTNTRLNVAKYIKKVGDDMGNSVCENWIRGSEVNIKKLVDQESCKNEVRGKRWNRKGDSEQPTVWLESELSQTKKLLLEYGLWTEGHQFRADSNSKWDIEHKENSGLQWSCKREVSLDGRDFWISCDLFQKSN